MPTSEEPGVAELFILTVVWLIFIATSRSELPTIQVGLNHCAFDFTAFITVNVRSQHHFVGTAHLVSASGFDHAYFL
jgi:hypothetical protein